MFLLKFCEGTMLKVGACLFRSTQRMAGVHGGVGFHRRGGMSCGFAAEATKVAEGGEGETAEVNADLEMKKAFLSSMVEMCPKWIKSARIEKASLQINQGEKTWCLLSFDRMFHVHCRVGMNLL